MVGKLHEVNLSEEDQLPVWRTVRELSTLMDTGNLTLFGGLMTYLHARRGGVTMPRATDDADFLIDYLANRSQLSDVRAALFGMNFVLKSDERFAYRFVHADGRKVDIMVADHLPAHSRPRLARLPALEAPAGAQAMRRRDSYRLSFRTQTAVISLPDELGALIAKSAAYLVDSRDRGRHLDDAATILASIADASALSYSPASRNDRKRVRLIKAALANSSSSPWLNLDADSRRRGFLNLHFVAQHMGVD